VLNSLVRVSRRGIDKHFVQKGAALKEACAPPPPARGRRPPLQRRLRYPRPMEPAPRNRQAGRAHCLTRVSCERFHALLTSLSASFSSFAHATCSLSVSRSYLAFEGIYLRLWPAIPNKPTLRSPLKNCTLPRRGYHPLGRRVPADLAGGAVVVWRDRLQFRPEGWILVCALRSSLAVTGRIPVGFFSSA